jgi:hypothetical protein
MSVLVSVLVIVLVVAVIVVVGHVGHDTSRG